MLVRGGVFVAVDFKIIFTITLKSSAYKIILVHSHSSGKLGNGLKDKAIKNKIFGKVLFIEECDHIIVSEDVCFSLQIDGNFE